MIYRIAQNKTLQKGTAMLEFSILLPLLLLSVMGLTDLARMIYRQQLLSDLSRETANLVSRGTDPVSAIDSVIQTSEVFNVESEGFVIISTVRRRDNVTSDPWVWEQTTSGGLTEVTSRVGLPDGPADVPGIDDVPLGVTIMAVELVQDFEPIFGIPSLALDFYPETLYQVAYF